MGNKFKTGLEARFVLAFLAVVLVFSAFAKTPIEEAVDLLHAKEPAKARAILIEELKIEQSAITYANLATAELALRNQAEASYAYEMARALGGFADSETFRQNLQQGLPAELRSLSDSPFRKVLQPILRVAPQNLFAVLAIVAGLLGCLLGTAMLFRAGFSSQSWSKLVLIALVALSIGGLVLAKARSSYRNPSSGVVMESTQLYKAPSTQSERLRALPEGAVVELGELLSGTYQVTLPTGVSGWVPAEDLRKVEILNLQ